ncbi:DgyrCDS780 [Dimorphilus gyrociliatus]|uniref:DgyrCDS780 n=1 Tax=Dimorphilus gyrociliatus TaxID=2664684 RepID=A0A7I8V755_9ANNE|nr:DgyrCDS780 [Dimorphilus gyrociliatus]
MATYFFKLSTFLLISLILYNKTHQTYLSSLDETLELFDSDYQPKTNEIGKDTLEVWLEKLLDKSECTSCKEIVDTTIFYDVATLQNPLRTVSKHYELAELTSSIIINYLKDSCFLVEPLHSHPPETNNSYTKAKQYGYGTIAVFIISISCLIGIFIFKLKGSKAYDFVMAAALGLAAGALLGDTFLHLIPHSLGLHNHDNHDHDHDHGHNHSGSDNHTHPLSLSHRNNIEYKNFFTVQHEHEGETSSGIKVEPFVWKMLSTLASLWAFFALQYILHYFSERLQDSSTVQPVIDPENLNEKPLEKVESIEEEKPKIHRSVAWMATIGDGVHNFADGLAIGAAFSVGWKSGISTSLAVLLHEVPHEIGDMAIMFDAGWSVKRAALLNFLSACTAFIGLYIGVAVSSTDETRNWIFAITAGMFIYVAAVDILPELLDRLKGRENIKKFLVANGGSLIGIGLMLILAIFEEKIRIN